MGIFKRFFSKKHQLTKENSFSKEKLTYLHNIIRDLPGLIYWKDLSGRYLGCNQFAADLMKKNGVIETANITEVIGKTDFDLFDKVTAEQYNRNDQLVIKDKKSITQEEVVTQDDGQVIYQLSVKRPLYDEGNKIIGVIGNTVDVTDQKKVEHLELENEIQKKLLEQLEKFKSTLYQFVHDVQSPVSGIMSMARNFPLPESERIALRDAAMRVGDMSRNLLNKYNKKEGDDTTLEVAEPVLISVAILDLLTEKRYQFKDRSIRFEDAFEDYFAFINVEPGAFSRMVSNIINNAVDAFDGKEGRVTVGLEATQAEVIITIEDNGKGMPPALVEKIMNNIEVSEGKEDGHGIGLTQVREALARNHGEFKIESTVGKGTKIILTFPRVIAPAWIAEEIKLGGEDIVVVLDDEDSIAAAWQSRFATALKDSPNIKVHYFKVGAEALNFMNSLPALDKKKVFLLTDFELISQGLSGLNVVEQSGVERSVLATSHHMNKDVRAQAAKVATKILPKQLAPEVGITIDTNMQYALSEAPKKTDIVLIDDDENLAQVMILVAFSDLQVDHYMIPEQFLKNIAKYPKDVKICIDKNFAGSAFDGLSLAKKLHEEGYTRLFLCSGETFSKGETPDYLTVVPKMEMSSLRDL